ncbi:site-specific integrase [Sphaerisporangium krabiense]|uniref:Integrase n=1 Tax=Sphaerisporangium krabiense TaxID=763782 RepID=A0A7W8Z328_9ACTN|nr:tyrosine-type recombinase/integrase [Sphaerisporangium krabiense]MBB5626562.1 integrase [Sphaerisporangium krabiense]GII63482.1 site-specific integrase [Sphaerisporangium krabiense]
MGARKPNGRSSIYFGNDGYWHGWVVVGTKPDGSPDRRHRMAKTETEVTRKVQELEGKRETGHVGKPGRVPTVTEWMTEYLDVICKRLVASDKMAPRTLEDYRSKTRHWIIPLLGRHRLDKLGPEHLDQAYATMLERGLSSSTVLKIHRILSRALKIAVRRRKITTNVATMVDAPVANDPDIDALTREEARRILEVAKTRRNGARWSVALSLGIRQGEALGLRWSFVDLDSGVIKAWYQVQRRPWEHGCDDSHACGGEWHRWPCKKRCGEHKHKKDCPEGCKERGHVCPTRTCPKECTGHAERCPKRRGGGLVFRQRKGKHRLTLQCPPELLPILQAHREWQAAEREKAGDLWEDHDLVFATQRGRPMERSEDYKMWKAILKQAGVRDARLHDARHTAGTLLVEQGVHIRVVQEILGHARVTTTQRYTHVAGSLMRDASERMGSALWGDG